MTLYEYVLKMEAYLLSRVDNDRDIHLAAWKNQEVKATKGKGKNIEPYYKDFNSFFNYYKAKKKVLGETTEEIKDKNLSNLMLKANE